MPQRPPLLLLVYSVILTIALWLSSCTPAQKKEDQLERIEHQIDSLLLLHSAFESASVGIICPDGKFKIHKGKLLNGQAPNDETLYEIASITKTFTGLLLSHALIDKNIDLDDDIRPYLPQEYANLSPYHSLISFRHLATHRSGLPLLFPHDEALYQLPLDWDKLPFEINRIQRHFTKAQFFESLKQFKLDTIPGSETIYSNVGTNLIGYILEELYKKSFEQLLADKILSPLGMKNTTSSLSKVDTSRLARGKNGNGIVMPFRVEKAMNAEGGILSNLDDMIKYLDYHLNSTSAVVSKAHTTLIDEDPDEYHKGLFWQLNEEIDKPYSLYQLGGAYGTSSWMGLIPQMKIGVFLITNSSAPDVHDQLEQTATKIFQLLIKDSEQPAEH